jgi:hypothetical protein
VATAMVGRVTPCAPILDFNRRAEDCPPYQFESVAGRRSYNPDLLEFENDFAAALGL